jgi:S-adenosylmethionine hydrolase
MNPPVIALLTDFGTDDYFVASLKAVILSIQPGARFVDISHAVPSFDIGRASFILGASYVFFPTGTIFIVVVDPGVGSKRRLVLVKTKKHFFIAPDNGVLSHVLAAEKPEIVIHVTNRRFFLRAVGRTFDGRDRMAPTAAWLTRGYKPEEFGRRVRSLKTIPVSASRVLKNKEVGHVVYIDKFGNCITDISSERILHGRALQKAGRPAVFFHGQKAAFEENYAAGRSGELICVPGSLGTIELAVRGGSAAALTGARPGDEVLILGRRLFAGTRSAGRL